MPVTVTGSKTAPFYVCTLIIFYSDINDCENRSVSVRLKYLQSNIHAVISYVMLLDPMNMTQLLVISKFH